MTAQKSVVLMAVGDIMLGDSPVCDGFGVGSQIERHGAIFPFEPCLDTLKSADLLFGNLEAVVSRFDRRKAAFEQSIFRGQPESIDGLVAAGFDVLALPTNHMMQHGQAALEESVQLLQKAGIGITGISCPKLGVNNLHTVQVNGLKLGFLAYNFRPQQYFLDPPAWEEPDDESTIDDLRAVRHQFDYLIVSLHWGHEFIDYPSIEQIELAHRLIDAGANLILGHHPHIVQGIEMYRNGLIAYSLGNFVFDMWQPQFRKTFILKCLLTEGGKIEFDLVPIEINRKWQPEIMKGEAGEDWRRDIRLLGERIASPSTPEEYATALHLKEQAYRSDVVRWYLSHLFRYRPGRLLGNFGRSLKRRLIPGKRVKQGQ